MPKGRAVAMRFKTDVPVESLVSELAECIPGWMKADRVPGLAVALIRDAAPVWTAGFGVKSAASEDPVQADTVFEAASLSKPVFACHVLALCERGILDLDRPLSEFMPGSYEIDDPRVSQMTTRMALSHTTGFSNRWSPDMPLTVKFPPGERFSYANDGYDYVGRAIESLSGRSITEYMKADVLDPVGMRASSFGWRDDLKERLASGHSSEGEPRELRLFSGRVCASRHLYTSARDYAALMAAVMNPRGADDLGLGGGAGPLHRSCASTAGAATQMFEPQVRVNDSLSWALGWGIQHQGGIDSFFHWGDSGEFRNFAVGCREPGVGVVVLTNGANGPKVYERIVRQAMGGDHPAFMWLREGGHPE